ncbi:MAG: Holliday junction helicase RuvA, holliday junction helicase RuvA [Parcubacteria group bacterium]|nr:Holliday junction helicase RuvA, holliday junction helicase RuvA [Parcubacteria group bacterium]
MAVPQGSRVKWYDILMIREIRGTVLSVELTGAVVNVGGWGIQVYLPSTNGLLPGNEVALKTYLCIKQDGVDLYGFENEEDRKFFELLLSVSGVGPKTAMSIQRKAPREALESAIGTRDISYLTRVIGLSKKAAEKIMVEVSEKVGKDARAHDDADTEVFDTLVALGYNDREARLAVSGIPPTIVGKDARLKAALTAASR